MNEIKIYCQDCKFFSAGLQYVYGTRRYAYYCDAKNNVIFYKKRKGYAMFSSNRSIVCSHYKRREKLWWQFYINGITN